MFTYTMYRLSKNSKSNMESFYAMMGYPICIDVMIIYFLIFFI